MNKNFLIMILHKVLDWEKDPNPEHWRTISGAKVHLDENGEIDGGAGGNFNGNYWDGKKGQQHIIGPHTMIKKQNQSGATNVMLQGFGTFGKTSVAQNTHNTKKAEPVPVIMSKEQAEKLSKQDSFVGQSHKEMQQYGVEYKPCKLLKKKPTEQEIINTIAGPDKTGGSCASLALAYVGQENGINVVDFRGGISRAFFSRGRNYAEVCGKENVAAEYETSNDITAAKHLLKELDKYPVGKQFIMVVGKHAAVVRKNGDGKLEYLELQSAAKNGWVKFAETNGFMVKTAEETLRYRFGCQKSHRVLGRSQKRRSYLIDCDKLKNSERFKYYLGYINTNEYQQQKGEGGGIK